MAAGEEVVPLFILDPVLLSSPNAGARRVGWLYAGLRELDKSLRARGSGLVIRRGSPTEQLLTLLAETGADRVFAEADVSTYARRRDAAVGVELPLTLVDGLTVYPPDVILKADGTPYTVFTPFSRQWRALPQPTRNSLLPAPDSNSLPRRHLLVAHTRRAGLVGGVPFPAGRRRGPASSGDFASGESAPIQRYAEQRNRMDLAGTSELSPYLRFGMLSARQAVVAALEGLRRRPTADEPGWECGRLAQRADLARVLHGDPVPLPARPGAQLPAELRSHSLGKTTLTTFAAWCEGRTGYPVVDAAMRQLVQTRLDAQPGAHDRRLFPGQGSADRLALGRAVLHAAPGGRRPGSQQRRLAVDAGHRHRRCALLSHLQSQSCRAKVRSAGRLRAPLGAGAGRVPEKYIHEPWKMPHTVQTDSLCVIGKDYPEPIVDHASARLTTLEAYGRGSS